MLVRVNLAHKPNDVSLPLTAIPPVNKNKNRWKLEEIKKNLLGYHPNNLSWDGQISWHVL